MPIVYVYSDDVTGGDVTKAPEKIIVHGCNAQGDMNSGVAKAIRAKWPYAYTAYRKYYEQRVADPRFGFKLETGLNIVARCDDKFIVNSITQEFYGRDPNVVYVSYDAIRKCLKGIKTLAKHLGETTIAIPKIGAGLGNGDWNTIEKIIMDELSEFTVKVYVP